MNGPQSLDFQLINMNADYIEFIVSYVIKEDKWRVDGIGWIQAGNPMYYLRRLRLDGTPAKVSAYSRKALLTKKKMSYKFNNAILEELVISNIEKIFSAMSRTPKKSMRAEQQ